MYEKACKKMALCAAVFEPFSILDRGAPFAPFPQSMEVLSPNDREATTSRYCQNWEEYFCALPHPFAHPLGVSWGKGAYL